MLKKKHAEAFLPSDLSHRPLTSPPAFLFFLQLSTFFMLFRAFSHAHPCSRRFSPPNFLLFLSCTMLFFGVKCDLDLVLCSKTLSHFYFAQSCEPCERCAASRSWQGHTAGCTVLQKVHCRLHSYANGTMPQAMRCRTRNSTHPSGEGAFLMACRNEKRRLSHGVFFRLHLHFT